MQKKEIEDLIVHHAMEKIRIKKEIEKLRKLFRFHSEALTKLSMELEKK